MEKDIKKCPFCAEMIKVDAIRCKHCKSDLEWSKVSMIQGENRGYKEKNLATVLAMFFWGAGLHKFYLWQYVQWVLYLAFIWTFIPAIIGFFEGLSYFSQSKEYWDYKINWIGEEPKQKNHQFFAKS